jgi:hypothetical protein
MDSLKRCRSCHSNKLIDVLDTGNQHLSEFRNDDTLPDSYPIGLVMCKTCSLVQLKQSTPPDRLYTDNYGYYSGINNTIRADLLNIAETIPRYVTLAKDDVIVDIGSNDGTLLKFYPAELARIGFDPVTKFKKFYNQKNLSLVNDYFNKDALIKELKRRKLTKKPKVITAISCFYDLEDPNQFVMDVRDSLHPEGVFVIEQNYLATMLENIAFDNIVHEHVEYYSLMSLEKLLNRHYLKVVDVKVNDINGGAFRTYVKHMSNLEKMRIVEKQMMLDNQWTYMKFGMEVKQTAKKVHDFVKKVTDDGKKVYIYGASTRGNSLLQVCGIDKSMITAAVERNPIKYGKKFLGIPIISEDQARKDKPDYMLVMPWFFKDEFLKRELEYLKQGGKLVFPLPVFEVYGYKDISSESVD